MPLNKHAILASDDLPTREVKVPEWGGSVRLRTLSVSEGIAFEEAKNALHENKIVALFLTFALGDVDGRRLFAEADAEDLCRKSPTVLLRLFNEALAFNRMGDGGDAERQEKS